MRVLAIESATSVAALAIVEENAVVAEAVLNTGKTHSQRLMPMLGKLLEEADLELQDLDGIVVSGGPGSFTGLRIGLATAKGLAYASQKPLVTVSTLDSLAYNVKGYPHLICPILNARRNEVYTAVYRDAGEELEMVMTYAALSPAELVNRLLPLAEPVMFLGDAVPLLGTYLREQLGSQAQLATIFASLPSAAVLGWLGLQKLKKGQVADLVAAKPLYIRPSEAEVKWQQMNR